MMMMMMKTEIKYFNTRTLSAHTTRWMKTTLHFHNLYPEW